MNFTLAWLAEKVTGVTIGPTKAEVAARSKT
jgi:hypothetical protein